VVCLFESSVCFEQLCAHPQEDNSNKHIIKEIARQVGYLLKLYENARFEKYKIQDLFLTPAVWSINLLKPTGYVMQQQFNIQQLYALPTLYLCVLYLSENKQRLVPLTA
jgi:hypothetical protein